MSPEYNFYLHAKLKDDEEAEKLAEKLRRLQGVEIVAATTPMELVKEMSLGEFVHYLRVQSGLSMNKLSALADLSGGTISDIEKGRRGHRISDTTAAKLVLGFGFEAEDPRTQLFYEKLGEANKPLGS